ncbi:MAG: polymerase subunit delta [Patescibacteria group bacterium]|nr:AAA family ATPase [Candidatus Saccharibacteria bacterium]MDQ5963468.1 polymerase subunit delta [Patescibacteria group bacterium]
MGSIDFTGLLVHEHTSKTLNGLVSSPPQAIILAGPAGLGKGAVASCFAAAVLGVSPKSLAKSPYVVAIQPNKGGIAIDAIRDLHDFLLRKVPGLGLKRRAILIEDADTMSTPAQNALLKSLEEPPEDTIIILTTSNVQTLLPTIRSRAAIVTVSAPRTSEIETFFETKGFALEKVKQAMRLHGSSVGSVLHYLTEESTEVEQIFADAKQFLGRDIYGRLVQVGTISKDREKALQICESVMVLSSAATRHAASRASAERWSTVAAASHRAIRQLQNNSNAKLVMCELATAF